MQQENAKKTALPADIVFILLPLFESCFLPKFLENMWFSAGFIHYLGHKSSIHVQDQPTPLISLA